MKIRSLWVLALASIIFTGCAKNSTTGSQEFSSGGSRSNVTSQQAASWLHTMQSPDNQASYTAAQQVPVGSLLNQDLNLVSNDPVQMGGYTFANLNDLIIAHAGDVDQLRGNYSTIGEYADAQGIASLNDVTPEQIQEAFDLMNKLFNQGQLDAYNASASNTAASAGASSDNALASGHSSTSSAAAVHGLYLDGAAGGGLSCAAASIGGAVASIGAGFACLGGFGLNCGAGLLMMMASSAGMKNFCPDPCTTTAAQPAAPRNPSCPATAGAATAGQPSYGQQGNYGASY